MPRLTKIYTRQGDDGTTGLGSGRRVAKDDHQVAAYGDVDELNAQIGAAIALGLTSALSGSLLRIQSELLNAGGALCLAGEPGMEEKTRRLIEKRHVDRLEAECDSLNASLGPLENFVLPGGTSAAAALHVARTVCRRAERKVVALAREVELPPEVLRYLNRLSDLLFIMARFENQAAGETDVLWDTSV